VEGFFDFWKVFKESLSFLFFFGGEGWFPRNSLGLKGKSLGNGGFPGIKMI